MQVSTALVQSLEELLQTAITRLTAEIKAETKPERLDTLLTLAFRARLPRIPSAPSFPRTSPAPLPGRAAGREHERPPEAKSHTNGVIPSSSFSTGRANGEEPQQPEAKSHANGEIPSLPHPRPQSGRGCRVLATGEDSAASLDVEDEVADEVEATTNEELPHYLTPMTDDEFTKLQREIGYHEANRRRLIRAHIAAEHSKRATNSP